MKKICYGDAEFELRRGVEVVRTFSSLTKFAQFVLDNPAFLYYNSNSHAGLGASYTPLTLHQVERSDILIAGKGKGDPSRVSKVDPSHIRHGSFTPGCQLGS